MRFFWPKKEKIEKFEILGEIFQTQTKDNWSDPTRAIKNWPNQTLVKKFWPKPITISSKLKDRWMDDDWFGSQTEATVGGEAYLSKTSSSVL